MQVLDKLVWMNRLSKFQYKYTGCELYLELHCDVLRVLLYQHPDWYLSRDIQCHTKPLIAVWSRCACVECSVFVSRHVLTHTYCSVNDLYLLLPSFTSGSNDAH